MFFKKTFGAKEASRPPRGAPYPMKRAKIIIILAVLASFAAAAWLFLDFVKDTRSYRSAGKGAEAIVVLTGGRGRIAEGLTQLRKGRGGILILSGVHEDADLDAIFLNRINTVERTRIVLEKRSTSTYENALEVRKILEERGIKSMILITSGYHVKRAHYIFTRVMPPDIKVEAYSVTTPNFDTERWWSGKSLGLLAIEFLKYYWYVGKFAVLGPPNATIANAAT